MVLPYELTREYLDVFFEKQVSPFPMVRQDLFFSDFMAGKKQYCSSALVRIICCLGCRILGGFDSALSHHAETADRLFEEATQLLKSTEGSVCNVPNANALELMSLHQLGAGEYQRAQELADEAVQRLNFMHPQAGSDVEIKRLRAVQATTFSGAISLARQECQRDLNGAQAD